MFSYIRPPPLSLSLAILRYNLTAVALLSVSLSLSLSLSPSSVASIGYKLTSNLRNKQFAAMVCIWSCTNKDHFICGG